jgi:hypothetical protein
LRERAAAAFGHKMGFCMGDSLIAEWDRFSQDPRRDLIQRQLGGCRATDAPLGTRMGLATGWGDVYRFDTEANFVEFGANTNGRYVVRAATNIGGAILETSDTDNISYAYVEITASAVHVIERGIGLSPWDPGRTVVDDTRPPNPG